MLFPEILPVAKMNPSDDIVLVFDGEPAKISRSRTLVSAT